MRPFFVFQNFGNGSHNPLGQESRREVLVLKPEIFMAIGGADDGAGGGTAAIRFRRGESRAGPTALGFSLLSDCQQGKESH